MKTSPLSLAAIILIAVLAFFGGRWSGKASEGGEPAASAEDARQVERRLGARPDRERRSSPTASSVRKSFRMSVGDAMALTSAERLDRLTKGAMIYNGSTQSEVLCNVIAALTRDEIDEASRLLGQTQDQGNAFSQQVWDSLWTQWGRLDPEGCIADFVNNPQGRPASDTRNVMKGWLETDPDAALAWALENKATPMEAAAAAEAIAFHSDGDPKKMEAFLQGLPSDSSAIRACFHDYFDIAGFKAGHSPADLYDELPPGLQERAWPVALERLGYTNPEAAAEWLTNHASEPGADYRAARRFVDGMAGADPAGTTTWAAQLPIHEAADEASGASHPAVVAVSKWLDSDPLAAIEWLRNQPPTTPWVNRYQNLLREQ